jgi:endonuclease/exonuclease/phosphatase family metal-dependent hydrolase
MKKVLLLVFFLYTHLYATTFKVASYNVENLFDNINDGTEYHDFKANSKYWNQDSYKIKLSNTLHTIKDLQSDIIFLQEIENKNVFNDLKRYLNYKYGKFHKKFNNAIGQAYFSKYPIKEFSTIKISNQKKHRDILKVTFMIDNKPFIVYANHWASKRNPSSDRIKSAYTLLQYINKHNRNDDYVILGDLNENHDEYLSLNHNKRINDSKGITAINHILNTVENDNFIQKNSILSFHKRVHFNPWLEIDANKRFSSLFKKQKNTPDNIILSQGLFDNRGISYIENSFQTFSSKYLFKYNKIYRWNKYEQNGYSDHLPVSALFTTDKLKTLNSFDTPHQSIDTISDLYKYNKLETPITLNNIFVLYKVDKFAIIKKQNDRAIQIYSQNVKKLSKGKFYTLKINQIGTYLGNKQINDFEITSTRKLNINLKDQYKNLIALETNNSNNLNEVIIKAKGIYKNKKFYYNNKSIQIYFKKNIKKPKNNSTILLHHAILSKYKTQTQLTIYSNDDFIVLD